MRTHPAFLALALAVATLAVYWPARRFQFLNYDDDLYVTKNVHVQSGLEWDTVPWAFTTYDGANWHPLTWLSHALDFQLFGRSPAGPHVVNLLLHTLNVLLLFWVLWRATGFAGRSAMVAGLFALHPINLQSVAWVAERKNLLSMTFFLLALGAYRWYAQWVPHSLDSAGDKPSHCSWEGGKIGRYLLVMLLFALGLMAKPQIITLPLVLLLWDYWPLGRMDSSNFFRLVWEKLPLLALAFASALITLRAQSAGHAVRLLPLSMRIANAVLSYARYIRRAVWPAHLAVFYPHPLVSLNTWPVLAAGVFLLGATVFVFRSSPFAVRQTDERADSERPTANSGVLPTRPYELAQERRANSGIVGWLWFLITLLPMIGIVQVGSQAMADRYAYLPFIGLFIMFVWGLGGWADQHHIPAKAQAAAGLALLLTLSVVTRRQLDYWHDSVTLWTHTLAVTSRNYLAEVDLGEALVERGQVGLAVEHFRAATAIDPEEPLGNMYLARYAQMQDHLPEAIAAYQKVIAATSDPDLKARAYSNMGYAYRALGDEAAARQCFAAAAGLGH